MLLQYLKNTLVRTSEPFNNRKALISFLNRSNSRGICNILVTSSEVEPFPNLTISFRIQMLIDKEYVYYRT